MWLSKNNIERLIKIIIEQKPKLSKEELLSRIEEKIAQLGGIVDKEGAAILVAKELGIQIPREEILLNTSKLEIADLVPGLNNISLIARIAKIQGPYTTSSGRKLVILEIYDKTRSVVLKIWDDMIEKILSKELKPGDCVLIEGAYSKRFQGNLELGVSSIGKIHKMNAHECKEIPSIEYIANERDDILLGVIIEQAKSLKPMYTCVFGFINDKPFAGNLPETASLSVVPQKVIIQDARLVETNSACYLNLTQNSKIYALGAPEEHLVQELSSKFDEILLRGLYLGYELSRQKGGRIYIYSNNNIEKVLVFDDYLLVPFSEKSPLEKLSIGPCYKINNSKKLRECFKASFSSKTIPQNNITKSKYLYNAKYIENTEVVITSARIIYRIIGDRHLMSLRFKVEDSSSFGILISNQKVYLEKIFHQKIEAIGDLPKNVREEILRYLEHESLGKRLIISGYVIRHFIIPTQVSPVDSFL